MSQREGYLPKCKALPLGQIHVPFFLQYRTLCVGGARRGGVWRRPLHKLTRFSIVHILHTEELLLQERPRRHQGKGSRQRRLLCRRGIALVAACGSGVAYGGVQRRRAAATSRSLIVNGLCCSYARIVYPNVHTMSEIS